MGARLIIQTAVEAEVDCVPRPGPLPAGRWTALMRGRGCRNGYCDSTIKTTAGPVTVARPKLRDTTERFASQLFGKGVTKSNALESLVIAGFVRGLSVRDVENTLADALGAEAACRSRRSRGCARRSPRSSRPGRLGGWTSWNWTTCSWTLPCSRCTPVPVPNRCWPRGASPPKARRYSSRWPPAERSPPTPGATSSTSSQARRLRPPLLVISDGAAGLINAAESSLPRSLRQRCLIHRCRNLLGQGARRGAARAA